MNENEEQSAPEKPMEVSSKNLKLALRIVQQKATVTEWPDGYDVDLIGVVGFRHEVRTDSKSEAIESAAHKLAESFERGEIELADSWEKDNLKSEK